MAKQIGRPSVLYCKLYMNPCVCHILMKSNTNRCPVMAYHIYIIAILKIVIAPCSPTASGRYGSVISLK